MQVFYINLDSQPERRDFVEANFKAHNREFARYLRLLAGRGASSLSDLDLTICTSH